jgi:oligosaccharide repeat unit polymerase
MTIDLVSLLIALISIVSLISMFVIMHYLNGSMMAVSISNLFMYKYVVFVFIGATLLNIFHFDYEVNLGLYDRKDLLLNTWYFALSGLFLIPFGMLIANIALKYKPISTLQLLKSQKLEIGLYENKYLYRLVVILFFISIAVLYFFISKIEILPIVGVISDLSTKELAFLRSESGYGFSGKSYRYDLFSTTLPTLLLLIVFFMRRESKKWNILFYFLIFYLSFVAIMQLHKAPLIHMVILLTLAYLFVNKNISFKKVFLIFFLSYLSLLIMYVFFMGKGDVPVLSLMSAPFHRIFIGSITPFYWYQLFQENFGFLYGTAMPNPMDIFPFEHRKISVEVMQFANPSAFEAGRVGSMPVVFYGNIYMNFGVIISIFSMVVFGFIIQILDIIFSSKLSKNKDLILSALYIYLIYFFGKYATTSFTGIIVDTRLWFPLLIMLTIHSFKSYKKNTKLFNKYLK